MEISSRNVVEGTARAPHRAMYKAMGLSDEDLANNSLVSATQEMKQRLVTFIFRD